MLIACYNVYNERKHIAESVASVYDKVGKIVFVDGRYKDFYKDKPAWSTDGTLKWIRDKANDPQGKFKLITAAKGGWETQAVKRTAYLIGKAGDIYLYIDGHEIITEWRTPNLSLDIAGMARVNLLENDPPISIKQIRLFAHKEGIKYLTHAYMLDKDDNFYLNIGWDQSTVLPPKRFDKEVNVESYSCTIKHHGKQNKEFKHRQEQVKEERTKIEVFDNAQGLGMKVDSAVAIDRVAEKYHEFYRKMFMVQGLRPISYAGIRKIVEAKAKLWEANQQAIRQKANVKAVKQVACPLCNRFIPSAMHLVEHFRTEHPKEVLE